MKFVEVEFSGAARAITKEKSVRLQVDEHASYRAIVSAIADQFPELIGILISNDRKSFLSATLFSRNGAEPVMPADMDQQPQDGERLLILYFIVGG